MSVGINLAHISLMAFTIPAAFEPDNIMVLPFLDFRELYIDTEIEYLLGGIYGCYTSPGSFQYFTESIHGKYSSKRQFLTFIHNMICS